MQSRKSCERYAKTFHSHSNIFHLFPTCSIDIPTYSIGIPTYSIHIPTCSIHIQHIPCIFYCRERGHLVTFGCFVNVSHTSRSEVRGINAKGIQKWHLRYSIEFLIYSINMPTYSNDVFWGLLFHAYSNTFYSYSNIFHSSSNICNRYSNALLLVDGVVL